MTRLTKADYPLAETQILRGKRGMALADITLDAVLAGHVTMEDLQITSQALQDQAEIAVDAGRPTLGLNFGRAAELVNVPQDVIMSTYELLRTGRAAKKQDILDRAAVFRYQYAAPAIADYLTEAAHIYEKRGVFTARF